MLDFLFSVSSNPQLVPCRTDLRNECNRLLRDRPRKRQQPRMQGDVPQPGIVKRRTERSAAAILNVAQHWMTPSGCLHSNLMHSARFQFNFQP